GGGRGVAAVSRGGRPRVPHGRHSPARATLKPQVNPLFDPARKAQSEARRTPWRLLALLIAMAGVGSLSLNILVPALPGLATKFAAQPARVALAASLLLAGVGGAPPVV